MKSEGLSQGAIDGHKEEQHNNVLAFQEVFGNEEDEGVYTQFKHDRLRSSIIGGTPVMPCKSDFCCDVDNVLTTVIKTQKRLEQFFNHYLFGVQEFGSEECQVLEQKIGIELRRRKLTPIQRYFRMQRGPKTNGTSRSSQSAI